MKALILSKLPGMLEHGAVKVVDTGTREFGKMLLHSEILLPSTGDMETALTALQAVIEGGSEIDTIIMYQSNVSVYHTLRRGNSVNNLVELLRPAYK